MCCALVARKSLIHPRNWPDLFVGTPYLFRRQETCTHITCTLTEAPAAGHKRGELDVRLLLHRGCQRVDILRAGGTV